MQSRSTSACAWPRPPMVEMLPGSLMSTRRTVMQITVAIKRRALWRERPPQSAAGRLFDHLVGGRDDGRRHGPAQGLCSPQIEHEFEFRDLFNGQVGGLRALQDPVDKIRAAPVHLREIFAIGYQAACNHPFPADEHAGKVLPYGEF